MHQQLITNVSQYQHLLDCPTSNIYVSVAEFGGRIFAVSHEDFKTLRPEKYVSGEIVTFSIRLMAHQSGLRCLVLDSDEAKDVLRGGDVSTSVATSAIEKADIILCAPETTVFTVIVRCFSCLAKVTK